jgi:hypothetical protein
MKTNQLMETSLENNQEILPIYERSNNMKISEFLAVSALLTSLGALGVEAGIKADTAVNQAQATMGNLQSQTIWTNAQSCALDKLVALGMTTQDALQAIATDDNTEVTTTLKECVVEIVGVPTNSYSGLPIWLQEALNK